MVALLDDLGTWEQLGTITPIVGEWIRFPKMSEHGYTTFRISYDVPDGLVYSHLRLRSVWGSYLKLATSSQQIRLYPKKESEIIQIPQTNEFNQQNLRRWFEVFKFFPYRKARRGNSDPVYNVTLEEFVPYPETVARLEQVSLTPSTENHLVTLIMTNLQNILPPAP